MDAICEDCKLGEHQACDGTRWVQTDEGLRALPCECGCPGWRIGEGD